VYHRGVRRQWVKDARKDRRHRDLVRNSFRAPYGPEQTPEEPVGETAAGEEFLELLGVVGACAPPRRRGRCRPYEVSYPLGKDAEGYIMYNPDGYMFVAIMSPYRINFAGWRSSERHTRGRGESRGDFPLLLWPV
jgi:hypothetical protein